MNRICCFIATIAVLALPAVTVAAPNDTGKSDRNRPAADSRTDASRSDTSKADTSKGDTDEPTDPELQPQQVESSGSVVIGGKKIEYRAVAGTLIVDDKKDEPAASMSYVAYFRRDAGSNRPVTFLYNGGPGSSTVWLHMGAFGPRRVITGDGERGPSAPYQVVNNEYSLLDVSDLVFIDAPGTGFGKIVPTLSDKDKDQGIDAKLKAKKEEGKDFFGVDEDVRAFGNFIEKFLSKYQRWNSPKYIFGESYGTMRSAALAYALQNKHNTDLNGVILLSQILNYDFDADEPEQNPGVDLPYALLLPTYAAGAWTHKKLPGAPRELLPLLAEVKQYALGDYLQALSKGGALGDAEKRAVAQKLHDYTGLPVDYLLKSNLRVNGGQFAKMLLNDEDLTIGRLDSRFTGPTIDPLEKEADYDPQSAAISSAYISAFNDYVRGTLKFGIGKTFKANNYGSGWNFSHRQPDTREPSDRAANVMPDLAAAMKKNARLKVMLNSGYFDMATPFFAADYEMNHLPIPQNLRQNIETHYYEAGHMMYVNPAALKALHDNVARFIASTDNQ